MSRHFLMQKRAGRNCSSFLHIFFNKRDRKDTSTLFLSQTELARAHKYTTQCVFKLCCVKCPSLQVLAVFAGGENGLA